MDFETQLISYNCYGEVGHASVRNNLDCSEVYWYSMRVEHMQKVQT